MTELDALAPSVPGSWTHENTTVSFTPQAAPGHIGVTRHGNAVDVRHGLSSKHIGERLVREITAHAVDADLSQREFELVMVGLVRSTVPDPVQAWATYYRNSLDELLSGAADFASIHERAESLVIGSVLDLGSCFGFFPLRLALSGHAVTATDLSAGTVGLLDTVAPHLGVTIETLICDAADVPLADNSVDTVTALHLLEHVDSDTGMRIIAEALRIARSRVVIAVPFEDEATACHGHVRTFDEAALIELGRATHTDFEVAEFHGGWLVLNSDQTLLASGIDRLGATADTEFAHQVADVKFDRCRRDKQLGADTVVGQSGCQ